MTRKWGQLRRSPIAVQLFRELCRGRSAWPWIFIALTPSRKPSFLEPHGALHLPLTAPEFHGREPFGSGEGHPAMISGLATLSHFPMSMVTRRGLLPIETWWSVYFRTCRLLDVTWG
jgi:hypothetical protein